MSTSSPILTVLFSIFCKLYINNHGLFPFSLSKSSLFILAPIWSILWRFPPNFSRWMSATLPFQTVLDPQVSKLYINNHRLFPFSISKTSLFILDSIWYILWRLSIIQTLIFYQIKNRVPFYRNIHHLIL
jgi:hypothetical protein